MFPELETRNFIYASLTLYVSILFAILHNYANYKNVKNLGSTPVTAVQGLFAKLAQKHKIFKPFASFIPWVCIEIFIISALQIILKGEFNGALGNAVGMHSGNYFGLVFFMPLAFLLISIFTWVNPLKELDIYTTFFPFMLFIDKIGCFGAGCCNGLWWPEGLYNYATHRNEIPIQLVESGCALLIGIFLLVYKKKAKPGTIFPLYVILFSTTRFISEFWRGQELVFGPFRYYHLFCAMGVVVGIVEYIFVIYYGDEITLYFDNTLYFSRDLKQKFKKFLSK